MTAWDDVIAAALLGTERRPPPGAGEEDGPVERVVAGVAGRSPAQALLGAAAALTVARRAGARAGAADAVEAPAPAADDPRPAAPPRAAAHLRALAAGVHAGLLDEWLAVADDTGVRPPHDALPALLDRATRRPALREAVRLAAGPRGAWLAARRDDWRWVLGPDDLGDADERWRTGTRAERLALLAALRRTDPARGRALVDATLAEDDPDTRAALVAALADGLTAADEPLLARALADRRKPVRAAAADLLLRLPASALAARMAAAARPVLRAEGRRYAVTPPDALPPELDARPPRGTGERAHRLEQLLGAAPLATWGDPRDALARELPGEWAAAVHAGWATAAVRQRDAAWARGLLAHRDDPALAALLPAADREEHAAARLARAGADPRAAQGIIALVDACPGPWGHALSDAALRAVTLALAARRPHGVDVLAADRAADWAARLHPDRLDRAEAALLDAAERAAYSARPALRALELVTARRDMLAALA